MCSPLKVVMFLGSTREGRMGERVAKFMRTRLEDKGLKVDLLDPLKLEKDVPLLRKPFHWYDDPTKAPTELQRCNDVIKNADAVVVISAEYNSLPPAALTNLMDHFDPAVYSYKPSGIVTYSMGGLGGARAAVTLRRYLTELGCLPVKDVFGISKVDNALDDSGEPVTDDVTPKNEGVIARANKLIEELEWLAHAMRNHRDKVKPPSL